MTRKNVIAIIVFLLAVLVLAPSLVVPFSSVSNASGHKGSISDPKFAWFFGYVGDSFYPQTQLNLSVAEMISEASNLSQAVGKSNLQLVTVLSQIPGHVVNFSNMSMVRPIINYVKNLSQYASVIYGRIDLFEFNTTTTPNIYYEVAKYKNFLGLNGVWLDHASEYYANVGQSFFNSLMQNLTEKHPNLHFIMNHTEHARGLITPFSNTTWAKMTYVSPALTCAKRGNCLVNSTLIGQLWQRFNGQVLVHFDAYAPWRGEPMSVFSSYNTSHEVTNLELLAEQGTNPPSGNLSLTYFMLYPIIGAWTYKNGPYHGTLYNSLTMGDYSRSTVSDFTEIMTLYS